MLLNDFMDYKMKKKRQFALKIEKVCLFNKDILLFY